MTAKDYHAQEAMLCYELHGTACVVCGKQAEGLAHIIPQRARELDKWGWLIVHSAHNMRPTCHAHNADLQIRECYYTQHAVHVMIKIQEDSND